MLHPEYVVGKTTYDYSRFDADVCHEAEAALELAVCGKSARTVGTPMFCFKQAIARQVMEIGGARRHLS